MPFSAQTEYWAHALSVQFVVTLIFVPASLKYLERLWGSIETLKFIVVSVGVSNIIAFGFNWIEFIATRNADMFLCVVSLVVYLYLTDLLSKVTGCNTTGNNRYR